MDALVGEIRLFAFAWAPVGWARCDGTLVSVEQYPQLFAVVGNQYGGDGKTTFALPDLRGRTPVHSGSTDDGLSLVQGEAAGQYQVVLTVGQMAPHSHPLRAYQKNREVEGGASSGAAVWQIQTSRADDATFLVGACDTGAANNWTWSSDTISETGENNPHSNMQPSLVINACIALEPITLQAQPLSTDLAAGSPEKSRTEKSSAEISSAHYLGEIRLFATDELPEGWVPCDGRRLDVEKHDSLYSLIGNWFGGDGIHEFAVPDFRGRIAVHAGKGPDGMPPLRVGTALGSETVALTSDQLPAHRHPLFDTRSAQSEASGAGITGTEPAHTGAAESQRADMAPLSQPVFSTDAATDAARDGRTDAEADAASVLHAETLGQSGLSEAHENMMPTIALCYAIAVDGIYPPEP